MYTPARRQSNIELLRIVTMLLIIAHHYVVSSGITDTLGVAYEVPAGELANYVFVQYWGMWGRTGINVFVLISGYFLCTSDLTIPRYCKVLFEKLFYDYTIFLVMVLLGREGTGVRHVLDLLFATFIYANSPSNFSASFLVFYLFVPFLNRIVRSCDRNRLRRVVLFLLGVYTGLGTFFNNKAIFGEVPWFCVLYLLASYLRLYPPRWSLSARASARLLAASVLVCWASEAVIIWCQATLHVKTYAGWLVVDCNKLGALLVSVFLLTTFKNLRIGYSRAINLVAKTCFGVLLIHTSSDAMTSFIWGDVFHVAASHALPLGALVARSVVIPLVVFAACSAVDLVRIFLLERPLFEHFQPIEDAIIRAGEGVRRAYGRLMGAVTDMACR